MLLQYVAVPVGWLQADMIKQAEQEADKDAALALLDLVAGKPGESLPPVRQTSPLALSPGGQPPETTDEDSKKTSPHVRGVTPPHHRHSPHQQTSTHSKDLGTAHQAILLLPSTGSALDSEAAVASGQAAAHTVANTAVISEVPRQTVQIAEEASLVSRMSKLLQDSQAPTGDGQLDLARSVVNTYNDFTSAKIHQHNHALAKVSQEQSGLDMCPANFHICRNKQERDAYMAAASKEAREYAPACKSTMMDTMKRLMREKENQAASRGEPQFITVHFHCIVRIRKHWHSSFIHSCSDNAWHGRMCNRRLAQAFAAMPKPILLIQLACVQKTKSQHAMSEKN